MRRYSPPYHSPPRRGYGGRGRSPPGRGYGGGGGGGYGRRREQPHGSLLVRNIPMDCRPEELRAPFERFGLVRDVYIPKDYYTGIQPRGFAFVEFVDPYEASEAQYHMNGKKFAGREIAVVLAAESRKRPEQMRQRSRRGPSDYGGRRSYYGRSRSRSVSRSRSPRHPSGSRSRHRSRSYSPAPRWRGDYSVSPSRRHADYPRSPRGAARERDGERSRQVYSPGYDNADGPDVDGNGNGYHDKPAFEGEDARANWRPSPDRTSRSPSGSRSRSADASPRHGR